MNSSFAKPMPQPRLLRDPVDWLLLLAVGSLIPSLLIYIADFWFRTNYRFFPVLLIVPLGLAIWRGRLQGDIGPRRWKSGGVLWLVGGLLALASAWLFSPWLALAALAVVWMAWSLLRLAANSWTRVIAWTLPLLVLLMLPLSDATDPLFGFVASVTAAASNWLDLLGVPQMPSELALDFRFGRIEVSEICRGLGNPYLLGTLTVLLCLATRPSFLVCLLTVVSVPMWAWGSAVSLVLLGSLLAEKFDIHLLLGYRLLILQALVLAAELFAIWLFQRGLILILSPFVAHSEGVGKWHKFYNSVVLWPDSDPLRKRRSSGSTTADDASSVAGALPQQRYVLVTAAVMLIVAGGLGYYQILAGRTAGRSGWELITQPHLPSSEIGRWVSQDTLPADFQGMQLVAFELRPIAGSSAAEAWSARWTYAHQQHTLQLSVALPWRGFYPRERHWLADGGMPLDERRSLENAVLSDGTVVLLDELVVRDALAGPSYLTYASWSPDGTLSRLAEMGQNWSWRNLLRSVQYQPNTASLSLYVPGQTVSSPAEREEYRRILLSTVDHF